jgi:hypothetical protein
MSEDQEHMTMKKGHCGILVATLLMGAWLAVAQRNTHPTLKRQSLAVQANISQVVALSTGRTNPANAVSLPGNDLHQHKKGQ